MLPIGLKKFLCLKKLKTLCREHISLVNLKTTTKFLERLQKRIAKNKLKRVWSLKSSKKKRRLCYIEKLW